MKKQMFLFMTAGNNFKIDSVTYQKWDQKQQSNIWL